jgi:hypothetical protein
MIRLIISILEKIEKHTSLKNKSHTLPWILTLLSGGATIWILSYFEYEFRHETNILNDYFLAPIALITFIGMMVVCAIKNINPYQITYRYFIPIVSGTIFLALFFIAIEQHDYDSYDFFVKHIIISSFLGMAVLLIIHPIFSLLHMRLPKPLKLIFRWLTNAYLNSLLILSIIAIFAFLPLLSELLRDFRYADESVRFLSSVFLPIFLIWICLLPLIRFCDIFNSDLPRSSGIKKMIFSFLSYFTLVLIFPIAPFAADHFAENRIEKAESIIDENGYTKAGLLDAKNIIWLKGAFWRQYENGNLRYGELFSKIFDQPFEEAFLHRFSEEDAQRIERRNATSAAGILTQNEFAKVNLAFAEYENQYLKELSAVETIATYNFQNTTNQQQEVVIEFELPTKNSVITDLKLGLELDLQGQVAARNAAQKVYQDSLRRRIDPALLQKTGPRSYRLRVFPVQGTNDRKTQGRQKVQFTFLTPYTQKHTALTLAPQLKSRNLRLNEATEIKVTFEKDQKIAHRLALSGVEQDFFAKPYTIPYQKEHPAASWCPNDELLFDLPDRSIPSDETPTIRIFFDVSASVAQNKNASKLYRQITKEFEPYRTHLHTYNFDVYEQATLKNLDFWGYSNTNNLVQYIERFAGSNDYIVIITDDDPFEYTEDKTSTSKDIAYKKFSNNSVSLINIGSDIKTYQDELMMLMLATDGDSYRINNKSEVEGLAQKIIKPKNETDETCQAIDNDDLQTQVDRLFAHKISRRLLTQIENEESWQNAALEQNQLAHDFGFVNVMNYPAAS